MRSSTWRPRLVRSGPASTSLRARRRGRTSSARSSEAAFEKADVLISLTGSCGAPAYAARVKELLKAKRIRTMSMVMRDLANFTSGGALADYRALHAEGQALAAIWAAGRRRGAQAMVNDRTRYRPAREVPHGAPSLEIRKEVARPLHHLVFGIRPIVEQRDEGMLVQLAARPSATRSRAHTRLAHRTCRGRPRGDGSGRSSSGIRADDPAPGRGDEGSAFDRAAVVTRRRGSPGSRCSPPRPAASGLSGWNCRSGAAAHPG